MESSYATLLEKTRLPQTSLQRVAVVSLFRRFESYPGGAASAYCRDVISQCLRSHSSAVVDQVIRELCRLVSTTGRFPVSAALIELQSSLEGCDRRFSPIFVKGIGFLCRFAFRTDPSWGRHFDIVELHPFVKVLSCCEAAQEELIQQVLLFIACNGSLETNDVVKFLRPFIMFSVIRKPSSSFSYFFSRNLISATSLLSCSLSLEAIEIMKLLVECLKYLPVTNEEEVVCIVHSAVHLVDAFIVYLQQNAGTAKEVAEDAQRCSLELLSMLFSLCAYHHGKVVGQIESITEISRHLLITQKELGLHYVDEFVKIVVSASVILTQLEFEHEQLSVLNVLLVLMEWKSEELTSRRPSCSLGEELLIVLPVINLLCSPSKPIKVAVAHLLSLAKSFILDFIIVAREAEFSWNYPSVLYEIENIPLRLLHQLLVQEQHFFCNSYFLGLTNDMLAYQTENSGGQFYQASQLGEHLLTNVGAKAELLARVKENQFEGMNLLLCSLASILLLHPTFGKSATESLVAFGLQDPTVGMALFQAALFYNNILCYNESNSSRILLSLLEMLPSLSCHSSMVQLIVQTILPILQKDTKPLLRGVAIRLLCKAWMASDKVFETLQDVLDPKTFRIFGSTREICLSVAASVCDVCKHNPDKGVELILSVSACIENPDSTVKVLGLQSLSYLCEADVIDFYTAWDVIAKHVDNYIEDHIVATGLATLLRWGSLDVAAHPEIASNVLLILWKIGTYMGHSSEISLLKARKSAFKSLIHYEIVHIQELVPDFKDQALQCLLAECSPEVLEAIEEWEMKIINYEHINRRRAVKERRPLAHKVKKLLDVLPKALFSPGSGNLNFNAREFPGAALLCYDFAPKDLLGMPNVVARVHAAFEKAVVDMAESLPLSQNLFIAFLAIESWKAFIQHWLKALVTYVDAKGSSTKLDDSLKIANDILKICCKVAAESIPQVSANAVLAVGALCLVVPSSCYATISSASNFLLKWLIGYEHEHLQWPSAISLGLIYNRLHVTDRSQKIKVIDSLLKVATNSKSHLVIGASGLGIGLACQGLLSSAEGDNSHRLMEATLLHDVIRSLSMVLNELCPCTFESLKNLAECFTLDNCDYKESSSLLYCRKLENLEGETWGVAGLVLGLGNSAVAVYRFGAVDAVLKIKDMLLSWIPSPESSTKESLFANEMFDMPLAVGACLAIPSIVAFCQKVELMIGDEMDKILIRYISLVSELLNSRKTGILYQNLLMASCIGAGSFVSYILGYGMHSMRYDDIRHLLEVLRNCYTKPCPPLVHLGGMIGVVNAFGAAAGDLSFKHIQPSFLPVRQEKQGSAFIRGAILWNPICENLSISYVQEIFLIAKDSKDHQIRKNAAWAVSFLRHRWCLEELEVFDGSEGISEVTKLQSQPFADDSLVWNMCLWLANIDYQQMNSSTVAAVLRCLSKAPRLPELDWSSILRGLMQSAASDAKEVQKMQTSSSLREECLHFSLARAKDFRSLLLFLDELADLSRFRTLELNLQSLLLRNALGLLRAFSGLRIGRLFEDFADFFSLSASPYFAYSPEQKILLRVSFWQGLYQCLNDDYKELLHVSKFEKCMECLFCLLPAFVYSVRSEGTLCAISEWDEAMRCMAKARHDWLVEVLQLSAHITQPEIAIRILAKVRLVKLGGLPFSELEKLKSYVLNVRLEGMWWSVLLEIIATLSVEEVSTKRRWLLDAFEVCCIAEYPSTAMRFIGLLSSSCCKYMPLLIVDPESVLLDLPLTLPSLLSSGSWSSIAESCVGKLWLCTRRICTWATTLSTATNGSLQESNHIHESEATASSILARVMHKTCLYLKDYLPLDKRLTLANIEVP